MSPAKPSTKLSIAQSRVLLLLIVSVGLNYIDRSNLSVAARSLGVELHLDTAKIGLLLSAFFWTYASMQIVGGWLVDRYDVKWVYGLGFLVWSGATAATGFVGGFAALLGCRLLLGIGESVAYPSYSKILCGNFPERHRGFANAAIDAGSKCGPAIGTLIGALLVSSYGWRALFIVLGFTSLIWLAPWAVWGPRDHVRPVSGISTGPGFLEILSKRDAWGTFIGLLCGNYVWYFLLTWLPYYLETERHFSHSTLAILSSLPFWGIAVVALIGGYVSDSLIARGYTPNVVRKSFVVSGLLLATLMLPSAFVQDPFTAIALLVAASMFFGLYTSNIWAITQTLAGPSAAGKWTGLQNGLGNLGGILAPALSGVIVKETKSFELAFVAAAVMLVIGAASFGFLIREVKPVDWQKGLLKPANQVLAQL